MANSKGKLTAGLPFSGLSDNVFTAENSITAINNMHISKLGSVKRRPGTRLLDNSDDRGYFAMFPIKISGTNLMIGIEYGTLHVFAFAEHYPEVTFKLKTMFPMAPFYDSKGGRSGQLSFKAGSRFRLLEGQHAYYLWSNSSEIIIIYKNGAVLFGKDIGFTHYHEETLDSIVQGFRAEHTNTGAIYVDAFPFLQHERPDLFFIEKDNYLAVVPAAMYIAEVSPNRGIGVFSERNTLTTDYAGGVFSPFEMQSIGRATHGALTNFPVNNDQTVYVSPTNENTQAIYHGNSWNPTVQADITPRMTLVYINEYHNFDISITPTDAIPDPGWYLVRIAEYRLYNDDGTLNTTLTFPVILEDGNTTGVPIRLNIHHDGLRQFSKSQQKQEYKEVWVTIDEHAEDYTDKRYFDSSTYDREEFDYKIYKITDPSAFPMPYPAGMYTEYPMMFDHPTSLSSVPTITSYDSQDNYVRLVKGFATPCGVLLHANRNGSGEVTSYSAADVALAIPYVSMLDKEVLTVREERFQHIYNYLPNGIATAGLMQGVDLREQALKVATTADFGFTNPDKVLNHMRYGYDLVVVDSTNGTAVFGKRGFNLVHSTSGDLYDISGISAITNGEIAPQDGWLMDYHAPFVSTKYATLTRQLLDADLANNTLPISLKGSRDIAIAGTQVYAIQDMNIIIGNAETLTMTDSVELRSAAKYIEPLGEGIVVFYDNSCEMLVNTKDGIVTKPIINNKVQAVKTLSGDGDSVLVVGADGEVSFVVIKRTRTGAYYYELEHMSEVAFDDALFHGVRDVVYSDGIYYIATSKDVHLASAEEGFVGKYSVADGRMISSLGLLHGELVLITFPEDDTRATSFGGLSEA